MSVVQASKGLLKPVSNHLLSETIIVCRLAKATLSNRSKIDWDKYAQHYDHIRQDIERTITGFENAPYKHHGLSQVPLSRSVGGRWERGQG